MLLEIYFTNKRIGCRSGRSTMILDLKCFATQITWHVHWIYFIIWSKIQLSLIQDIFQGSSVYFTWPVHRIWKTLPVTYLCQQRVCHSTWNLLQNAASLLRWPWICPWKYRKHITVINASIKIYVQQFHSFL